MKTTTMLSFKRKLTEYLDYVSNSRKVLIVSNGRNDVVIIPLKEYNSLVETGHLLSTAANRKRL